MKKQKALLGLFGTFSIMASMFLQAIPAHPAYADQITSRALTLEAGSTSGGSAPGAVVNHKFTFTLPNTVAANPTGKIGSIKFQYCTTAADVGAQTCVEPTGLLTANATLGTLSGVSGFTLVADPAGSPAGVEGSPYIHNASQPAISPGTAVTVELLSVTNPSATNQTFFTRISTYSSTDATGTPIDTGTVAASTANPVQLSGTMPESLVFCTGKVIGLTNSVPDCTTATTANLSFNQLFSPVSTAYSTSQMAASTNASSGYAITVNGATLTSGTNTITAMGTVDQSKFGISQFGLNLVVNDNTAGYANSPVVASFQDNAGDTEVASAAVSPASNGTNYNGQPSATPEYNTNGYFKFTSGDIVANSNNTGTDAQIYTVSYIVNVPGSQPAGNYTSTLTYICTPTF